MGTSIGKVLVLANVFISVGLLAWALAIYTNQPRYFDSTVAEQTVPGQFSQYTAEIKRLTDGIQVAQANYVAAMDRLVTIEQDRAFRQYVLGLLLDEVKNQGKPDAFFRVPERHTLPELRGLIDVFKYTPNNPFPPSMNLRNQPLKGFGRLQQEMANLLKDEKDKAEQVRKLREDTNKLSLEIIQPPTKEGLQYGLQPEFFKLKSILSNLSDEQQYLADLEVNWDEQLRTLKIRKAQLESAIAEATPPMLPPIEKGGQ